MIAVIYSESFLLLSHCIIICCAVIKLQSDPLSSLESGLSVSVSQWDMEQAAPGDPALFEHLNVWWHLFLSLYKSNMLCSVDVRMGCQRSVLLQTFDLIISSTAFIQSGHVDFCPGSREISCILAGSLINTKFNWAGYLKRLEMEKYESAATSVQWGILRAFQDFKIKLRYQHFKCKMDLFNSIVILLASCSMKFAFDMRFFFCSNHG